jgi:hypothetical protein
LLVFPKDPTNTELKALKPHPCLIQAVQELTPQISKTDNKDKDIPFVLSSNRYSGRVINNIIEYVEMLQYGDGDPGNSVGKHGIPPLKTQVKWQLLPLSLLSC